MNYYKYINNEKVEPMSPPKHISNPTAEQLAAYAAAHGYLPLIASDKTSCYHTLSYELGSEAITEVWVAPELEDLKAKLKEEAEAELASCLAYARLSVESLGFDVVFDSEAQTNVLGMLVMELADDFTDADDVVHALSLDDLQAVAMVMAAYKKSCHETKRARLDTINACESVEGLLLISNE